MSRARSSLPTLMRALALRDAPTAAAAGPSCARRALSASAKAPAAADPLAPTQTQRECQRTQSAQQTSGWAGDACVRRQGVAGARCDSSAAREGSGRDGRGSEEPPAPLLLGVPGCVPLPLACRWESSEREGAGDEVPEPPACAPPADGEAVV